MKLIVIITSLLIGLLSVGSFAIPKNVANAVDAPITAPLNAPQTAPDALPDVLAEKTVADTFTQEEVVTAPEERLHDGAMFTYIFSQTQNSILAMKVYNVYMQYKDFFYEYGYTTLIDELIVYGEANPINTHNLFVNLIRSKQ